MPVPASACAPPPLGVLRHPEVEGVVAVVVLSGCLLLYLLQLFPFSSGSSPPPRCLPVHLQRVRSAVCVVVVLSRISSRSNSLAPLLAMATQSTE